MDTVFQKPKGTYENPSFSSFISNRINSDFCPGASGKAIYTAIRQGQFNRTRNVILTVLKSYDEYQQFLSCNFLSLNPRNYLFDVNSISREDFSGPLCHHPEIRGDPSTKLNRCTQDLSQVNTRNALNAFRLNKALLLVESNQGAFSEEDSRLPEWARSTPRKGDSRSSQPYYEEAEVKQLFFELILSQEILLSTIYVNLSHFSS